MQGTEKNPTFQRFAFPPCDNPVAVVGRAEVDLALTSLKVEVFSLFHKWKNIKLRKQYK